MSCRRHVALAELSGPTARAQEEPAAPVADPPPRQPRDPGLPPERHAGLSLKKVAADAAERAEQELASRVLTETRWNRREASRPPQRRAPPH